MSTHSEKTPVSLLRHHSSACWLVLRLYLPQHLQPRAILELDSAQSHRLITVMRRQKGDELAVFNNQGAFLACVQRAHAKRAQIALGAQLQTPPAKALTIQIAQGVVARKRMDFVIQKTSELDADLLVPVVTQHTQFARYDTNRAMRIAHAAAEQCQRVVPMQVTTMLAFDTWLTQVPAASIKILAHHHALCEQDGAVKPQLLDTVMQPKGELVLLVGPEGGLNASEIQAAIQAGFTPVQFSARILRAETVALAALCVIDYWLQSYEALHGKPII